MFFRKITTKKNGKEYVYIKLIENYRLDGKVKQRVVANFGSLENLSASRINYLISSLRKLHNEVETQGTDSLRLPYPTSQVSEIRKIIEQSEIKKVMVDVMDQSQYPFAEALIIKAMVARDVNRPVHEICKEMGLIDGTSLQFYNAIKTLGEAEVKTSFIKTRLFGSQGNEKNHKPVFIHVLPGIFEGTSFEVDIPSNFYLPNNYQKHMNLLLACWDDGFIVDFEHAESVQEINEHLEMLVNRLHDQYKGPVVVLDTEDHLKGKNEKYMVARVASETPKEIPNPLNTGSIIVGNQIFFTMIQYEQKSIGKIKEIEANLAKVSAGLETIKADILLGKLNKESAVRKKAEAVIKANECQDLVDYRFHETSQKFNYHIKEEMVKEKSQSMVTTTWVIDQSVSKQDHLPDIGTVNIKTDRFKIITDQLKIPPINIYVDYHYSQDVISGHIQLEIIKYQLTKDLLKGGEVRST